MDVTFLPNNQVVVTPPKRPKKITGTRFAAVLGLNKWSSEFKTWCEITGVYKEPFEGNKYTEAGKTIEPKVAEYLKKKYFLTDLKSPEDVFGKDYVKTTNRNFFDHSIFGGMWDFKGDDYVVEVKTSSRPQDWEEGTPIYYLLQAYLYAYLLGVDKIYVVVSFPQDKDYDDPSSFECTLENTKIYEYSLNKDCPDFESEYITDALHWWKSHVETGMSPTYSDADSDIIKELKTKFYVPDSDDELLDLLKEIEKLNDFVEEINLKYDLDNVQKQIKTKKDLVKEFLVRQLDDNHDRANAQFNTTIYEVSTNKPKTKIDEKKLKEDGLYAKYSYEDTKPSYTLRVKQIKEED